MHAALPAFVDELLGGRGKRVRHRIPDVGPAAVLEIHRVFQIIRRQKLREPHGAGPGAFHIGERDVAALQDLQSQQKFLPEFFLAATEIGLRRQHTDRIMRVRGPAVIGLAAEDREQNSGRHAELAFDGVKRAAELREKFAALHREPFDHGLLQIIRRRLDEFRLARRRLLRPAGQDEIRQRQIGLKPACRGVERSARDAKGLRLGP